MTFSVRPFDPMPLSWWRGLRDRIDFDPPYQRRGGVWSPQVQAFLIDSILNGYDLPKFYVADFSVVRSPLNLRRKQFAIVDGKQRFEAVYSFYDGSLRLSADFVLFDDPTLSLENLSYRDLVNLYPRIAARFDGFIPSVMTIVTDDEARVNDLFVRLNQSKPLTGAEVRNAMPGVVPQIIRDLADHEYFSHRVRFSTLRGADRNSAAKLLLIEFKGRLVDTKKRHLDAFARLGLEQAEAGREDLDRAARRVRMVLRRMSRMFNERDPLLRSQGSTTLYYWLVRNNREIQSGAMREFLKLFEYERRQNREYVKKMGEGSDLIDAELLVFDNLNRSTNDVGSLEGRYRILLRRLRRFIELS